MSKILRRILTVMLALVLVLALPTSKTFAGDVSDDDPSISDNDPDGPFYVDDKWKITFNPNTPLGKEDFLSPVKEAYNYEPEDPTAAVLPDVVFELKGYTFVKWNTNEDYSGEDYLNKATVNLTENTHVHEKTLNLYAVWELKEIKVTYELYGGTNDPENPTEINYYTEDVTLKNPVKQGSVFEGWYTDESFEQKVAKLPTHTEKDIKLYAKWNESKYTIKFNANGGSGSMSDISGIKYSDTINLSANAFTRKYYDFKGWNTKADGTGTAYANKAAVSKLSLKNGDVITLYAIWTPTQYKITYKLDGGKNNAKNPSFYTYVSSKITLKNPSKTGFTFKGWYKDKKFKKKVTSIAKGSTGAVTLYAKWQANTYTIKFNANGGKGKMKSMSKLTYNKKYKLTANSFTKENYIFVGWNTKKNGKGVSYTNKQKISKLVSKNKGSITLYAQWRRSSYTIKFKGNGSTSGSMSSMKNLQVGKSYKLPANKFAKKGYVFRGWCIAKNGKDTIYKDKASIKDLTKKDGETITLYALWRRKSSDIPDMSDQEVFNYLVNHGLTTFGAAGLMGNLYAESGIISNNLENYYNTQFNMTDEQYTDAVDDGTYTNFVYDSAGYGIAQWTSSGRKLGLYETTIERSTSISDKGMQLDYLMYELENKYGSVLKALKSATNVRDASNEVLTKFERPKDQGESAKNLRATYGLKFYYLYSGASESDSMTEADCPFNVKVEISNLSIRKGPGTEYERSGYTGAGVFQIIHVKSGSGSSKGWGQLGSGGWISLDYCTKEKVLK